MIPPAARARSLASVLALALGAFGACAKEETGMSKLDLLPVPAEMVPGEGRLAIDAGFRVVVAGYSEPRLERAALRFLRRLAARTGIPLPPSLSKDKGTLTVRCDRAGEAVQSPAEDESYTLEIRSGSADLSSVTPVGALRGMETFLQLVAADREGYSARALVIRDRPRFPWRGLMIDACRHWQPPEVIKRNLDGMAAVKLNVLHWHLTEDQGFRVESKRYPRLHGMGSEGNFYSQEDVRDILDYARERGIRVVPEFDMPGHTGSWFLGHPELASAPGPFALERKYGINDHCMDPTREELYSVLDGFIGEMAALFPDAYLHIGGDEVNGRAWNSNAAIAAFKRQRGMKSNHDLQAYFNSRLLPIVQKHGKKTVGWDEILHPQLPKSSLIHSWRGQDSLAKAARDGYSGILSFGYYLDLARPASSHYAVDPLDKEAAKLSPEEQARVLGGEACMWSEWVTTDNIDSRIWPRAAAVAERLWSPRETRDTADMYRRLETLARQLEWLGLTHRTGPRRMLARLAGSEVVEPLEVLARVLEPVKDYARSSARSYTSLTPLNRLVDALQPESDQARTFNAQVEQLLAGGKEAESARTAVRESLRLWSGNHTRLEPMLRSSFLLAEAAPLSSDLSSAAAAGLAALDAASAGRLPSSAWKQDSMALLERAQKPRAEVLLQIVPGIRKLVGAVPEPAARPR